jgi:hypothetical protein
VDRTRRTFAAALAGVLALLMTACDGLASSDHDVEPPIELTGTIIVDPVNSGGDRVVTDYCDCLTSIVALIDGSGRVTSVECSGTYGLRPTGEGELVEATLVGPGWRVYHASNVPVSPHVGLRVDATCRDR